MDFSRYLYSERLSDVVFVMDDGQRIHAHKIMLCAQSEYFENLLDGHFAESHQGEVHSRPYYGMCSSGCRCRCMYVGEVQILF